jgi:hypothetical protein
MFYFLRFDKQLLILTKGKLVVRNERQDLKLIGPGNLFTVRCKKYTRVSQKVMPQVSEQSSYRYRIHFLEGHFIFR